jgi:hypothetical protein
MPGRGAVASFYVNIDFSAESRMWTSAYRTVSSYFEVPIDYIRTL